MLSKFLLNVLSRGYVDIEKGVLTVWNNQGYFFPLNSFVTLQDQLHLEFGKEYSDILYWLGKIQGNNSTMLIMKRFGFKPTLSNFKYFVDGSTLVGMGIMDLVKFDSTTKDTVIQCKNPTFAAIFKKMKGKQDNPVDYYMAGILAGGSEPLLEISMACKEIKCVAKGSKWCEYHIFPSKTYNPSFKCASKLDIKKLYKNSENIFVKRRGLFGSMFAKHKFHFDNGACVLDGISGVLIPSYLFAIFLRLISTKSKSKSNVVLSNLADTIVENLDISKVNHESINSLNINAILKQLNLFGFGNNTIKMISKRKMLIQNPFSCVMQDYKLLFGRQKKKPNDLNGFMIQSLLKKTIGKDFHFQKIKCISCGDPAMLYEVTFS